MNAYDEPPTQDGDYEFDRSEDRDNAERLIRARVAAGAAFLDVLKPKWAEQVDVHELVMENTRSCVLGQLYGFYNDGQDELGLTSDDCEMLGFVSMDRYYAIDVIDETEQYEFLDAFWRDEINKRNTHE